MKALKNFNLIKRSGSVPRQPNPQSRPPNSKAFESATPDSPEGAVLRACRLFCESGSPNNGGEEVLHLPAIVDGAESSPVAAASAAYQIRIFLAKEWSAKPHVQYNAVMLIRILSDHPGAIFTRNFDDAFVGAVKKNLRNCRDPGTQQILRETLDALEVSKRDDVGCKALLDMWRKEKGSNQLSTSTYPYGHVPLPSSGNAVYPQTPRQVNGGARASSLPSPGELSSRVEEAKNTAKILLQLIQSTPTNELLQNDLVREFNERCQTAQRSMQEYINCQSPQPDDDTMQTLIETNEQLSLSSSRYQRAMLAARRALGASPNLNPSTLSQQHHQTQPAATQNVYSSAFAARPEGASDSTGYANGANKYNPPSTRINGFEGHGSYQPPPSHAPAPINYYSDHTMPQQTAPVINPFADPRENDNSPPLAIEPTNYGWGQQQQQVQAQHQQNYHHHSASTSSYPNQLHPTHNSFPSQTFDSRRVSQASTSAYSTGVPSISDVPTTTSAFAPAPPSSMSSHQQSIPSSYHHQPPLSSYAPSAVHHSTSSASASSNPRRRNTLDPDPSDTGSEPRSANSFHPSPILHSAGPSSATTSPSTSRHHSVLHHHHHLQSQNYQQPQQQQQQPHVVSPQSPPRPSANAQPWHTSEIRGSYLQRQESAGEHLTMHGGAGGSFHGASGGRLGGGAVAAVEIDGDSEVGRRERVRPEYSGGGRGQGFVIT